MGRREVSWDAGEPILAASYSCPHEDAYPEDGRSSLEVDCHISLAPHISHTLGFREPMTYLIRSPPQYNEEGKKKSFAIGERRQVGTWTPR